MDILSDEQYRVLGFIAACNRSHYNPTPEEVMLWSDNPTPTGAVYRDVRRQVGRSPFDFGIEVKSFPLDTASSRMMASMVGDSVRHWQRTLLTNLKLDAGQFRDLAHTVRTVTERELVQPAETLLQHLVRITWLEEIAPPGEVSTRLRLTDLGRALIRDMEAERDFDENVSVVVLGREDPLAYPMLVGQLAAVGPGLFVDPYLKLQDVHTVVVSTQLTRLLISGKPHNKSVVASMEAYLESPSLGRRVEVRASTDLHDRVLIADDGDVLTVGTSLNGVGHTTTVITPIPSPARDSLRTEYERLWAEASIVGPAMRQDEPGDGGQSNQPDHSDPSDGSNESDDEG